MSQKTIGSAAQLRQHLDTLTAERDEALAHVAVLQQALDTAKATPTERVKQLQRENKALRQLISDLVVGFVTGGPRLNWQEWREIREASKERASQLLGEV